MPPRRNSRHLYTSATKRDADGPLFLSDRVPYRFRPLPDNEPYEVREGDTLWSIAAERYAALGDLPRTSAAMLYWVIADFQPIPIHDPTVQLVPGEKLILPSVRTVQEQVLQRRDG